MSDIKHDLEHEVYLDPKDKKEHIQSILDDSKVQREWITKYNSYPTKNDVDHIY